MNSSYGEWAEASLHYAALKTAAVAIYEACRVEAADSGRPIIPEPWEKRDAAFRAQFEKTIERICAPGYDTTPEKEHISWVRAYEQMGWTYGPIRDVATKKHPDMLPFAELPESERQKDAIFLACCAVARSLLYPVRELEAALEDMVYQFAYKSNRGEVHTGGLSALESAFDLLKWDNPHPAPKEMLCDEPGCKDFISCGFPTETGYRQTCSKHYAALRPPEPPREVAP